jgi:hypothetical protein
MSWFVVRCHRNWRQKKMSKKNKIATTSNFSVEKRMEAPINLTPKFFALLPPLFEKEEIQAITSVFAELGKEDPAKKTPRSTELHHHLKDLQFKLDGVVVSFQSTLQKELQILDLIKVN